MVRLFCAQQRRSLFRSACLGASLIACAVSAATDDAEQTPRDLRYGVTLFHYYQQQYFDALTELTSAQVMKQLPAQGAEAELLRGGISLSYGMDREAKQVFEAILEDAGENVDRDQVWFFLGKMAWRRGNDRASAEALGRMSPDYNGPVADEAHYLKAVQLLDAGDSSVAYGHIESLSDPCPFQPYFHYNQGVLLAAAQEWQLSGTAFRAVAEPDCSGTEAIALKDRALVAAGFSDLSAENQAQAAADFLGVRLYGPESDRALLGYGWSLANQGDYTGALVPWRELESRELVTASARESLIAVPYAYEQLGREASALKRYSKAAERYAREQVNLAAAIDQVRDGDLMQLFGLENAADQAWLGGEDPMPEGEHAVYLSHLMSTDEVQLSLRELRDLYDMHRRLALASERLAVLHQVDGEQHAAWQQTLAGGQVEILASQRERLLQHTAELRERLERAAADNDGRALANTTITARWQRLEDTQVLAEKLEDDRAIARLRLMQGLMHWEDSEAFPGRLWALRSELGQLEALAEESATALASVHAAATELQQTSFESRISALEQRTAAQQVVVDSALDRSAEGLRATVLAELEKQREQLALGEGRARLAMARLYDQASPGVLQ